MNPALKLLTELSIDPFQLDDFLRDPDPLVAGAGVAPADLPLLARRGGLAPDASWACCTFCGDPGYDPLPDPDVPPPPPDLCPSSPPPSTSV
jgi:hypothetical protein